MNLLGKTEHCYEALFELAKECGFTHCVPLEIPTLNFMQEVRDMCGSGKCGNYGKSWSCPPACPTPDEMRDRAEKYAYGLLVQTVGVIEDSLDWDGMLAVEARHKESFARMRTLLEKDFGSALALGSGCCQLCQSCTYPTAPCRHPARMELSMEACGLLVSNLCADNKLGYNYGPGKTSFTGCFMW